MKSSDHNASPENDLALPPPREKAGNGNISHVFLQQYYIPQITLCQIKKETDSRIPQTAVPQKASSRFAFVAPFVVQTQRRIRPDHQHVEDVQEKNGWEKVYNPTKATVVYQKDWGDGYGDDWILCYPDKIIKISPAFEITDEDLKVIDEKLGSL